MLDVDARETLTGARNPGDFILRVTMLSERTLVEGYTLIFCGRGLRISGDRHSRERPCGGRSFLVRLLSFMLGTGFKGISSFPVSFIERIIMRPMDFEVMLPNMPHSRMPPTPPLRPGPRPGVAKGQGPRVKGRVLPNSPRSAPLTGGRFRRPAKTHEGTPSGAHFSHRCRAWRPAGGSRECRDAGCVYGSPPA